MVLGNVPYFRKNNVNMLATSYLGVAWSKLDAGTNFNKVSIVWIVLTGLQFETPQRKLLMEVDGIYYHPSW